MIHDRYDDERLDEALIADLKSICVADVGEKAADVFAREFAHQIEHLKVIGPELFVDFASRCESEIERIMLAAILFIGTGYENHSRFPTATTETGAPHDIKIAAQHPVGPYRVDFAILVTPVAPGPPLKLAIECDGHDFHERTKEQARRDKNRDRVLASFGYHVLRFTGSEIWRDARACAAQIERIIDAKNDELIQSHLRGGDPKESS